MSESRLTVAELIVKLQAMPQDAIAITKSVDSGKFYPYYRVIVAPELYHEDIVIDLNSMLGDGVSHRDKFVVLK